MTEERFVGQNRRQADRYAHFTKSLLELFVKTRTRKEYLDSVLLVLQRLSGCRCVGVRVIDEQFNIPYESYVGFTEEFWARENWLNVREHQCVCIRVMRREPTGEELRCITTGGSFWTGDAPAFVASLPEAAIPQYRGNCIKEGFRSLAVIPLVYTGQTLGVVHLADEEPDLLSLETIDAIEVMAPLIGEAVHRFNVEDQLRNNYQRLQRSEEQYRLMFEAAQQAERQLRDSHAALEEKTQQLRLLASELSQTEQRERRRLAGILHDHLQQYLVGARFHLAAALPGVEGESARAAVQMVDELIRESLEVSRSLTVELCPPLLYDEGFPAALEWLAQQKRDKYGLRVNLRVDPEANPADPETRVLLFEAVRELLFNVVKHAGVQAATVMVELASSEMIRVEVSDKGRGFDPAEARRPGGFGLFSINERLGLLGSKLEISSTSGRGSRFVFCVPLKKG